MNLSLQDKKGLNLEELIKNYFEDEMIEGYSVECKNGNYTEDVIMSKNIIRFPSTLFISLKRFTYNLKKIKKMIEFEETIDFDNIFNCNGNNKYDLCNDYAFRKLFGGHYYYCKNK